MVVVCVFILKLDLYIVPIRVKWLILTKSIVTSFSGRNSSSDLTRFMYDNFENEY